MSITPRIICGQCGTWKPIARECRGLPFHKDGHFNPDVVCQECFDQEETRKREETEWLNSYQAICEKCGGNFNYPKSETNPPKRCPKCAGAVRKCFQCAKPFDSEIPKRFCSDQCEEDWQEKKDNERADKWWREVCPAGYRDTDVARLPNAIASKSVLEWSYGRTGLFLKGRTGTGKTRSIYLLLKRLVREDCTVSFLRSSEFAREVVDRTKPENAGGIGGFEEWFGRLQFVDVLVFDEVEKIKFTTRVESEFFDLLENRVSHNLPIIFASNSTVTGFVHRMQPDFKAATQRRILENCHAVNFDL